MRKKSTLFILSVFILLFSFHDLSHAAPDYGRLKEILGRECVNLKKEKLFGLIQRGFAHELGRGVEPEFFSIVEGVVKRTDFDGISEDRTYRIIRLVYGAWKKGAPLEELDEIFDVAYSKEVSADSLAAASRALKEFRESDVPQSVYEEFVYHSLEEQWEPKAMGALSRGLIYGVERGLTPERLALAIIVDVDQGVLKSRGADELVSGAIRLVREMEPEKWRPPGHMERERKRIEEERRALDKLRKEAEAQKRREEELKRSEREAQSRAEAERAARELEEARRKAADMARRYEEGERELVRAAEAASRELELERERKRAAREAQRERALEDLERSIASAGKGGLVNIYSAVEKYLGIPYRYGGDSENGIDCSAFTRRVYREFGVELPRSSREQARVGQAVPETVLSAGDLVFFDTSIMGSISHVGVYLDSSTFAHASKLRGVTKSSLKEKYYYKRFVKANRVFKD